MNAPTIYHYDRETGELLSQSIAMASPGSPDPENPTWRFPAFSTAIEPPRAEVNEVAVFQDGAWKIEPDYRGATWYDENGNSVKIKDIGDPSEKGLTNVEPVLPEPEPAFQKLAAQQFWKAANQIGITIDGIKKGVSDTTSDYYISDEANRNDILIDIDKAPYFDRDNPVIVMLAKANGIPEEQIDSLWHWAESLI